jgi:dTMP kinase
MMVARGRFIALEGGEGAGKSTQLRALADRLRERGVDVLETREPGGSPGAEAIRALLLHGPDDAWLPRAEALLFAAARSDHVARTILPALEQGRWVLCDRFVDSSRAYQGGASGLDDADIVELHRIGSAGLLPDRTLLLRVDPATANARRDQRRLAQPDRFEDREDGFHARVAAAFDSIAAQEPDRVRVVDAVGDRDDVTARLMLALADLLP